MNVQSLFRITPGLREKHNDRWDTAFGGNYLCRLPDGRLVRSSDYEEALQSFKPKTTKDLESVTCLRCSGR